MNRTGSGVASRGAPFLVLHGGELVPALLGAWLRAHGHRPEPIADLDDLRAFVAITRPEGVVLPADPAAIATWHAACPDGPAPWIVVPEPDPALLSMALEAGPAGLLTSPPGAVLVEGLEAAPVGAPGWAQLAERSGPLLGESGLGRHGRWIMACLSAGEARASARGLLAPVLAEHLGQLELQLLQADQGAPRPLPLPELLSAVAVHRAVSAAMRHVRLAVGEVRDALVVTPGPLVRLLDLAVGALADSLGPGGRLVLHGDASGIRLVREPGDGQDDGHMATGAPGAVVAAARDAGVVLAMDEGPLPTLTIRPAGPETPAPPAVPPRVVLLEPDPFMRAWAQAQPGGRGLAAPAWRPGEPWPLEAAAPGAWVVVDDALRAEAMASAPSGATAQGVALRGTYGHGKVRFPVIAATAPLEPLGGWAGMRGPGPGRSADAHLADPIMALTAPPPDLAPSPSAPVAPVPQEARPARSERGRLEPPSVGTVAVLGAMAAFLLAVALAVGHGRQAPPDHPAPPRPVRPAAGQVAPGRLQAVASAPRPVAMTGSVNRPSQARGRARRTAPTSHAEPSEDGAGAPGGPADAPSAGSSARPSSPPGGDQAPTPTAAPPPPGPLADATPVPPSGVPASALDPGAPPASPRPVVPRDDPAAGPAAALPATPPAGRREVVIARADRVAVLREGGREVARFPIAVGARGKETPQGTFRIAAVVNDPPYVGRGGVQAPFRVDPANPLGTRWVALDRPPYGLHGTNDPLRLGDAVSAGCVRFANDAIEALARWAPPGTPVRVVERSQPD